MKCPLLVIHMLQEPNKVDLAKVECGKEECAWWGTWTTEKSEEQSGCCLPVLTSIMSEIMSKMPHEEQFRR